MKKLITLISIQVILFGNINAQCNGTAQFTNSGQNLGDLNNLGTPCLSLGDLDGDGDLDAYIGKSGAWNEPHRENEVWFNDGTGVFSNSGQLIGNSTTDDVALGDVDGDGDLDAIDANFYDTSNTYYNIVWLNNGTGFFTAGDTMYHSDYSHGVSLGDLDGDGDLDAFVIHNSYYKVWLNDSNGNFIDNGQNLLSGSSSREIALGDLDGDGDLDACIAHYSGSWTGLPATEIWFNDGNANFFDSGQALGAGGQQNASGCDLADLDGDGDLDVFISQQNCGTCSNKVWLNDGNGTFTDSGQNLGNSHSQGVDLADMEGDGDIDAFISTYSGGNEVWLNDGTGNFINSGQTLGSGTSYDVSLADLDGDLDIDAFVANSGGYNTVWFNENPFIDLTMTYNSTTCAGFCDGIATANVVGTYSPFTYSWNDSASQTTATATGLCPDYYTVTVSDSNNCFTVQDSVEVTNVVPIITTSMSTAQATCSGICDGTATVSASGTYPPFSYLWNDPSGQTSATATGLCAGWYSVSVTDANGCITVQDSVEVTNVVPTITTTVSSTTTQCGSCTGTATVSASGTYPPFSYLWNDPSGQTSATATGLCEQQYTVTVTDTYGCTIVSDSVVVGSNAYPAPSICLISVDSSSTKNLIAWEKPITNGIDSFRVYRDLVGTYNYIGSVPYDSLSQFMDDSPGINPNVTSYRYKISIMDTCGLESPMSAYHETIHLTTNVGVGGEVNLIWDDYEGFSFGYYRILRDSTFTNTWEVLDSVSFTNFTYTDLTPPSVNAAYAVEVLPPSTCTSTKAVNHNSSRSNRGTILGGMAPQSDFNSDLTLVTEGGSVNFFDQSLNVPTAWNWTFTGGTPSSSGAQNPTGIVYDTPGLYNVQLIAINSNGSDTLVKVDYIEVVPMSGSAPACDFVADFTQITEGGSVNFLDQTLNTPTGWTWLFTGGSPGFSTTQHPSGVVYSTPGAYDVKLIATNANGNDTLVKTDYIEVLPATSIQEYIEESLKLYPNPTNDRVTVELSELALPCNLEIKDINDRLIKAEAITSTTTAIDLSVLEGSVYLFRLYNSDFTHTAKVVKQ